MVEKKVTPTSVWLTKEVQQQLDEYCTKHASNRSEVVRRAIEQYLKEDS